ncbi:2194_t:CDS:1, partial [Funneliformis geosporum]
LSDIYFDESNINNIQKKMLGRKKTLVWEYFEEDGEKKNRHIRCICKLCGWTRKVGKAFEMVEHLAFTCMQATGEIKNIFLQEIKNRTTYENSSSTTTSSTTASSSTKRIKVQNQKITT